MKKILITIILSLFSSCLFAEELNGILGINFGDSKQTVINKFTSLNWDTIPNSESDISVKKENAKIENISVDSIDCKFSDNKLYLITIKYPLMIRNSDKDNEFVEMWNKLWKSKEFSSPKSSKFGDLTVMTYLSNYGITAELVFGFVNDYIMYTVIFKTESTKNIAPNIPNTKFYKNYYVDKFGDKTNNWYINSQTIYGKSNNTIGGTTEFKCQICVDDKSVFFDLSRKNGDRYSGDGVVYVKLENGETKRFSAKNYSNGFYPTDTTGIRNLLLREKSIKFVIEIPGTDYSFNLGNIDLTELHSLLK